jgi:hypothetical protein
MPKGRLYNWEVMARMGRRSRGTRSDRKLACCLSVYEEAISNRHPKDSSCAHKGLVTNWLHHNITSVQLMGVYLTAVHLIGVPLNMHLTGMYLIYESGGENPYIDTQDGLKASDCGLLGRQAADHPWSALRVVKSCRKTAQRPRCCSKLKQQLCIQNGARACYLNYLQCGRVRRGQEAQAIGLASQSDGQKSDGQTGDRQIEERQTGQNKAGERWYPSRPCSVLSSSL